MKNFDVVYDAAEADHMFWRVALHFWNKSLTSSSAELVWNI